MTYRYNVNAYFDNAETTLKTNDIKTALDEFFECVEEGVHCDIMDGFTGEILVSANTDEPWITDEMSLMMLGYLCAEQWGEEDDEEEDEMVTVLSLVNELAENCSAIKCKICGLPS